MIDYLPFLKLLIVLRKRELFACTHTRTYEKENTRLLLIRLLNF